MAYKLMKTDDINDAGRVCTFFSDTKSEFPATGGAVKSALGLTEHILAGSKVYTAKMEIGVLNSDDDWEWGDE